jgi:GH24 family phage-related lysozyme (muramidase)
MYKNLYNNARAMADRIQAGEAGYIPKKEKSPAEGLMRRTMEESDSQREDMLTTLSQYLASVRQVPLKDEGTKDGAMRPVSRAEGLGITGLDNSGDWVATTASVLRDLEGFKEKPYYDVNAFRAGYGSDTYTTASGEVIPVTEASRVSREDAERDLNRRIQTEFGQRARETAGDAWDSYNAMQKAALTSIAYNYGSIPDRIAGAVRSGNPRRVSQAIQTLRGDNDGINSRRRLMEAEMMLYGAEE